MSLNARLDEKGLYHCDFGPALYHPVYETEELSSMWFVHGISLDPEEVLLAKKILARDLKMVPLYVNHPKLRYFCLRVLKFG